MVIARAPLIPDQCRRICLGSTRGAGASASHPTKIIEGPKSISTASLRVHAIEIGERDERRHGEPGALDDDPLPARCLVDDLSEATAHVEGAHGSHGPIIAISWQAAIRPR